MSTKTTWHKIVLMLSALAFAGTLCILAACSSTPEEQTEGQTNAVEQAEEPTAGEEATGEDAETTEGDEVTEGDTETTESTEPTEGATEPAEETEPAAEGSDAAEESEPAGTEATETEEPTEPVADEVVEAEPAVVEFSMTGDCTPCHTGPAASAEDETCLASTHAVFSCTICHNQEEQLVTAHEGVALGDKEPLRIRKAKITEDVCLGCHVSYEALAEKTADVTVLTDINGVTVNPHVAKGLCVQHEENITCLKCHAIHDPADDQKAYKFCVNCHHSKEFVCGTCHETPAV